MDRINPGERQAYMRGGAEARWYEQVMRESGSNHVTAQMVHSIGDVATDATRDVVPIEPPVGPQLLPVAEQPIV